MDQISDKCIICGIDGDGFSCGHRSGNPDEPDEIDTSNKFLVRAAGDKIAFLKPLPMVISQDDALLLAAYIVAIVADQDKWERVLTAVE